MNIDHGRSVDAPVMLRAADVQPASYRADDNSIEIVWSTGAAGLRFDWIDDTYYVEELSMDAGAIRLGRLNAGAPLLDSHQACTIQSILGSVEPGSARVANGIGTCRVRLADTPDVADAVAKIKAGHARSVSVGYAVYEYVRTEEPGKTPHLLATDWEPMEVSIVATPFDAGAQVRTRSADKGGNHPCFIRGAAAPSQETTMPDPVIEPADDTAPVNETIVNTPEPIEPAPADENVRSAVVTLARISDACRGLGDADARDLMVRHETEPFTHDTLLTEVTRRFAERNAVPNIDNSRTTPAATVTVDERDKFRRAMVGALSVRINDSLAAPTDGGELFGSRSALEIGRVYLERQGVRTNLMGTLELAGAAFGLTRHGALTSSDFAIALQQAGDIRILQSYENYEETWRPLARETTARDFRPVPIVGMVGTNEFQVIAENGEYTYGSFVDLGDSFKLWTAGKAFSFSRQLLINDQLGLIGERMDNIGEGASIHEANAFWALINSNVIMNDGNALFSAAHGNLAAVGGPIDGVTIAAGRAAMRKQKNRDGVHTANIVPKYLVVGPDKEGEALQFLTTINPTRVGDAVPAWVSSLTLIVEPRITGNAWYLFADPARAAVVQVAYLAGASRLYTDSRVSWDVDGVQYKGRVDFSAKAIGYAGAFKNPGN